MTVYNKERTVNISFKLGYTYEYKFNEIVGSSDRIKFLNLLADYHDL